MTQEIYRFHRKWQTVLYELSRVCSIQSWEPLSMWNAWNLCNHDYLRWMGITTYDSFEHHVRRLRQWGYLYRLPRPKRTSRYDSNHYTYLLSKAGINKLLTLGVLYQSDAIKIKKMITETARYYKIPIKR